MKLNPTLKLSTLALLAIATAVLVPHPALAQPFGHLINITENSSTSLSFTFDNSTTGFTVINLGPDQWSVIFPFFFNGFTPRSAWVEPENALSANELTTAGNAISVFSDVAFAGRLAP